MSKHVHLAWFGLTLMIFGAALRAQTTNTFPSSGNVGIGTTTPVGKLSVASGDPGTWGTGPYSWSDVYSLFGSNSNSTAGAALALSYSNTDDMANITSLAPGVAWKPLRIAADSILFNTLTANGGNTMVIKSTGNVGIGTASPSGTLHIVTPSDTTSGQPQSFTSAETLLAGKTGNGGSVFASYNQATDVGFIGALSAGIAWRSLVLNAGGGNVGIGTTAPGYKFDVAGQIHTSGSIVFADNTTQSTAWTGSLCGGDYAESIDVSDDRRKYEPGDVLVIDPHVEGKFLKSAEPYATGVAGIYSTKPGVVGRRQTTARNLDEIPMAVVGIVPAKVSAENGAIRPGDLLVTSSTPGYAMKGTDRGMLTGAIVGKAMGSLASGSGVIEVLVSLQ